MSRPDARKTATQSTGAFELAGRVQRDEGHARDDQRRVVHPDGADHVQRHEAARTGPIGELQAVGPFTERMPLVCELRMRLHVLQVVAVGVVPPVRVGRRVGMPQRGKCLLRSIDEHGGRFVEWRLV
jgi:hypothetical protein